MAEKNFNDVVAAIVREDGRYDKAAYHFVRQALDHTLKKVAPDPNRPGRHVTGKELLAGIREYSLEQFGPMAYTILEHWGIRRTEDFGAIVFNMVEYGVLSKTDQDSPEDFRDGYDFREAFLSPFAPKTKRPSRLQLCEEDDEGE